jgi:hypothetical protein
VNNELIARKSWWKRNWKWLVPFTGVLLILVFSLFPAGFGGILGDYSKAYTEPTLYEVALKKFA